jgi:hypothetical protein
LTLCEAQTYTERMKVRRAFVAIVAVGSCLLLQPGAAAAQAIERALYVSVLDSGGQPVEGLNESAFVVREDGVAREVLRVVPASDPMQIALLVDNSAAASSSIIPLRQGLTRFITAMTEPIEGGGMNQIALITLAERPTIAADYTTDREALLKAVNTIFPQTGSAAYLLDALVEIGQGLARQNAMRPVIVSVTTEGPDYSSRNRQQALAALDRAGGTYQAIVLGPAGSDLSDEARDRAIVLAQGTEAHGGQQDILLTNMSLPNRLEALAKELRSQYKVVYARPDTLIPPEEVTVAAADRQMKAFGTPMKEPAGRGRR